MTRFAVAVVLAGFAFHDDGPGCGKRSPHPHRPETPLATPQAVPANTEVVTRYEDEVKQAPEERKVAWKAVEVKRAAGHGDLVAVLTLGNPVTTVARSGAYELVSFTDPTGPSRRLRAWVSTNVFDRDKDPGPPKLPTACTSSLECGADSECDAFVTTTRSGLEGYKVCRALLPK